MASPVKTQSKKEVAISALTDQDNFSIELKNIIENCLQDDKAEDVVIIDLEGKSALADYMIIASGRSSRHIQSMAKKLADKLKTIKAVSFNIEGLGSAEWVVFDAGDVIIHLFQKETREYYNLEKIWTIGTPKNIESVSS